MISQHIQMIHVVRYEELHIFYIRLYYSVLFGNCFKFSPLPTRSTELAVVSHNYPTTLQTLDIFLSIQLEPVPRMTVV